MRILITGVSGFVGQRLARRLVGRGHELAGTYISGRPDLPDVDLHEVDLLDRSGLERTLRCQAPEVIVHLAGLSHVGESWSRPGEYFQVNVLGSENLLQAAGGTRMLVASSAEVYGAVPEDEQPIPESRPLAPPSPYSLTKASMERLALRHDAIIVRSFNIIGPGQARTFALPAFADQLAAIRAAERPPLLQVGNLAARRDFVHVDDAVAAYEVLVASGLPREVYNLGTGDSFSIQEVLDRLIAVSGLAPEVVVDPRRFRPVDLPLLRADNSKLRQLGWAPARSLDDALRDLWQMSITELAGRASPGTPSSA